MEARRETETTEVFSMVLGFILAKTLCPQRHSKVCFELLETFWVTPKRTCLSVICSSVVGQLRWKEHIKKHKKFLQQFKIMAPCQFVRHCLTNWKSKVKLTHIDKIRSAKAFSVSCCQILCKVYK